MSWAKCRGRTTGRSGLREDPIRAFRDNGGVAVGASQASQSHLEDGTTYHPLRPTEEDSNLFHAVKKSARAEPSPPA